MESSVLVGMFDSRATAEDAHRQLIDAGFPATSVTIAGGTADGAMSSDGTSSDRAPAMDEMAPQHEGAIARFFRGLFGEDDAKDDSAGTYHEAFRRGSYGVSVTTDDDAQMQRAERILNEAGAVDIDERAQQWRSEGWSGGTTAGAPAGGTALGAMATGAATTGAAPDRAASAASSGTTQTLQEVEEQLKVGKRAVARGGVRIHSRVVEVPVQASVTLREEHADVQRRAVDREATAADLAAFKEGTIEVREMSEEAVVGKTARVVGEVEIGKRVSEREETVSDTVRKTKVEVEQIEPSTGATTSTPVTTDRKPV